MRRLAVLLFALALLAGCAQAPVADKVDGPRYTAAVQSAAVMCNVKATVTDGRYVITSFLPSGFTRAERRECMGSSVYLAYIKTRPIE